MMNSTVHPVVVATCACVLGTAIALGAVAAPVHANALQNAGSQPLDSTFLTGTELGRRIHDYLRCVDFDCQRKMQEVIKSGPDALTALIRLLNSGVSADVRATLPGDPSLLVPVRATIAMGALGNRQAVGAIAGALQDPKALVRATAVEALGTLGGDEAFNALLRALEDPDDLVRENTAQALARLGRREALAPLRTAVQTEEKLHVRKALEGAIKSLDQR